MTYNKLFPSLFPILFVLGINLFAQNGNTVTISGRVTDFDGNPMSYSVVQLKFKDFSTAYETYVDNNGYYKLENVEKGRYMGLFAMRLNEYPQGNAVPEENTRLEFWAWNIIADKDLKINPRYHRLELQGFQVFEVYGDSPYLMAYVRPMSLSKYLAHGEDFLMNKGTPGNTSEISIDLKDIEFKLYAENEPLTIRSVQSVYEYTDEDHQSIRAFLLQFDRPKEVSDENYQIFRIEATYKAFGIEKGENLYFYEPKKYK